MLSFVRRLHIMALTKHDYKAITLDDKCQILEALDKGSSIRQASKKFCVPKFTVENIKKNKDKVRHFVSRSFHRSGKIYFSFINSS